MGGTPITTPKKASLPSSREVKGTLVRRLLKEMKLNDSASLIVIMGKTGAGKSQYAMKIAYQFYKDWDLVLRYMVFTPFDFQEIIQGIDQEDGWIPVIVWDDAGPWLELIKRASWHPLAIGLRGTFETMRVRVGAIIFTMTIDRSLPRSLAYDGNLYKFRAKVVRNGWTNAGTPKSLARIQERKERKNEWGRFYWEETMRDYFALDVPIYNKYNVLRKKFLKLYLKLVMKSRELGMKEVLNYIYEEWKRMRSDLTDNGVDQV